MPQNVVYKNPGTCTSCSGEHDCVPQLQGRAQRLMPRRDDDLPTGQSGWSPVAVVEIYMVLIEATRDTVDVPATVGEARHNGGTGDNPVFVQRAT